MSAFEAAPPSAPQAPPEDLLAAMEAFEAPKDPGLARYAADLQSGAEAAVKTRLMTAGPAAGIDAPRAVQGVQTVAGLLRRYPSADRMPLADRERFEAAMADAGPFVEQARQGMRSRTGRPGPDPLDAFTKPTDPKALTAFRQSQEKQDREHRVRKAGGWLEGLAREAARAAADDPANTQAAVGAAREKAAAEFERQTGFPLGPEFREHFEESLREAPKAEQLRRAYEKAKAGGESAKDYAIGLIPFVGAAYGADRANEVTQAAERIQKGQGLPDDYDQVGAFMAQTERDKEKTLHRKVWDTLASLPGFAAEFGATGGAFTGAKAGTQKLATKLLGEAAERGATGLATKALGAGAGVAAQTLANPARVGEAIAERRLPAVGLSENRAVVRGPDESMAESVVKGTLDALIETGTERAGAALGPLAGALAKIPAGRRGEVVKKAAAWVGQKLSAGAGKAPGFHGPAGEITEERLGEVLRGATGVSPDYGVTGSPLSKEGLEQLAVEGLSFAVFGAGAKAADKLRGRMFPLKEDADTIPLRSEGEYPVSPPTGPVRTVVEPEVADISRRQDDISRRPSDVTEGEVISERQLPRELTGPVRGRQRALPAPEAEGAAELAGVQSRAEKRDLDDAMRGNAGFPDLGKLPREVADRFQAHGTDLKGMAAVLRGGIDRGRAFHTAALSDPSGSDGLGLRDFQPFLLVGEPGKGLKEGGVKYVLVDANYEPEIPKLRKLFPGVEFIGRDQAPRRLAEVLQGAAQTAGPEQNVLQGAVPRGRQRQPQGQSPLDTEAKVAETLGRGPGPGAATPPGGEGPAAQGDRVDAAGAATPQGPRPDPVLSALRESNVGLTLKQLADKTGLHGPKLSERLAELGAAVARFREGTAKTFIYKATGQEPPPRPKGQKPKKKSSGPKTLIGEILARGGVDPDVLAQDYSLKLDIQQQGLAGILRKGGRKLDELAEELQAENLIPTRPNQNATDTLIDALQRRLDLNPKSEAEYAEAEAAYYKQVEEELADEARRQSQRQGRPQAAVGEAVRSGEEAGVLDEARGAAEEEAGDTAEAEGVADDPSSDPWAEAEPEPEPAPSAARVTKPSGLERVRRLQAEYPQYQPEDEDEDAPEARPSAKERADAKRAAEGDTPADRPLSVAKAFRQGVASGETVEQIARRLAEGTKDIKPLAADAVEAGRRLADEKGWLEPPADQGLGRTAEQLRDDPEYDEIYINLAEGFEPPAGEEVDESRLPVFVAHLRQAAKLDPDVALDEVLRQAAQDVLRDYAAQVEKVKRLSAAELARAEADAEEAAAGADQLYSMLLPFRPRMERVRPDYMPSEAVAPDPEVERRLRAAHGIERPGLWQKAVEFGKAAWARATRAQEHLARTGKNAAANETFRLMKLVPQRAGDEVNRTVAAILDPLGPNQKKLFERKLIADNMVAAAERGEPLRFGFRSIGQLTDYQRQVTEAAEAIPEVKRSVEARRRIVREKVQELVAEGLLPAEALNNADNYFHQMVLMKMQEARLARGGLGMKTRSFQKARVQAGPEREGSMGEEYDYNTDYVEAEIRWMTEAQIELEKKKLLTKLDDLYGILPRLKEEAARAGTTWERVLKNHPDYRAWSPAPGSVFYRAFAPQDRAAEQGQVSLLEEFGDTANVLGALVQQPAMVLPADVVAQLEAARKPEFKPVADAMRKAVSHWKAYQLTAPWNVIPYNLRNLTGDLDPILGGQMGAFKHAPRASQELWDHYHHQKLSMSPELRAARDLGVIDSGMTAEEIPDARDLKIFQRFYAGEQRLNPVGRYANLVRRYSSFREGLLRYSAFLAYREQLGKGTLRHYGGAKPEVVDALARDMGEDVAAAHLARNLLGDYGDLTVFGDWMRRHLAPFWSWQEINFKRTLRFVANAAKAGEFSRRGIPAASVYAGVQLARIGALYGMFWAVNHLLFPDEEDELDEDTRASPHIVLGRRDDGTVRVFHRVGALGDFLENFGVNALLENLPKYKNGQMGHDDLAKEMLKESANKLLQQAGPQYRVPLEAATGQKLYPNVFQPRPQDRAEAAAGAVDAVPLLRMLRGRPGKPNMAESWLGLSTSEPARNALFDVYSLKDLYLKKQGREPFKGGVSPHTHMRQAAIAGDYEAFKKARGEYLADGHGYESYQSFLRTLQPLHGLSIEDQKRFEENFLADDQRQKLRVARDYAGRMEVTLWKWWQDAAAEAGGDDKEATDAGTDKQIISAARKLSAPRPTSKGKPAEFRERMEAWEEGRKEGLDFLRRHGIDEARAKEVYRKHLQEEVRSPGTRGEHLQRLQGQLKKP